MMDKLGFYVIFKNCFGNGQFYLVCWICSLFHVGFGPFPLTLSNQGCAMKELVLCQGKWIIKGVFLNSKLKMLFLSPEVERNWTRRKEWTRVPLVGRLNWVIFSGSFLAHWFSDSVTRSNVFQWLSWILRSPCILLCFVIFRMCLSTLLIKCAFSWFLSPFWWK